MRERRTDCGGVDTELPSQCGIAENAAPDPGTRTRSGQSVPGMNHGPSKSCGRLRPARAAEANLYSCAYQKLSSMEYSNETAPPAGHHACHHASCSSRSAGPRAAAVVTSAAAHASAAACDGSTGETATNSP